MKKIIVLATSILVSCAALAQNFSFTNNNPKGGSPINATITCGAGKDEKYAMTGNIAPQGSAGINTAALAACEDNATLTIWLGTTSQSGMKTYQCDTKVYDPHATYTLWYDISGDGSKTYPYQCKLRS